MDFGKAIVALKQGKAIQRSGWNGKGLFVVKQIPASINADIIPKMQSLPQSAKDILMSRENPHIDYTNQMLIVNPDGRADSWVPSSSDVFAEDWCIIGEEETFLTRIKKRQQNFITDMRNLVSSLALIKFLWSLTSRKNC